MFAFPAGFSLNRHGKVRGLMKPSPFPRIVRPRRTRLYFPPKADQPQAEAGRHNFVDLRCKHSRMIERNKCPLILPSPNGRGRKDQTPIFLCFFFSAHALAEKVLGSEMLKGSGFPSRRGRRESACILYFKDFLPMPPTGFREIYREGHFQPAP